MKFITSHLVFVPAIILAVGMFLVLPVLVVQASTENSPVFQLAYDTAADPGMNGSCNNSVGLSTPCSHAMVVPTQTSTQSTTHQPCTVNPEDPDCTGTYIPTSTAPTSTSTPSTTSSNPTTNTHESCNVNPEDPDCIGTYTNNSSTSTNPTTNTHESCNVNPEDPDCTGTYTPTSTPTTTSSASNCVSDSHATKICNPLPQTDLETLVLKLLRYLVGVLGLIAVVAVVLAGARMVLSRGEPAEIKAAREMITYAILGVVISALAYTIIAVVQGILKA